MIKPKRVRKVSTGAIWVSRTDGVWKKESLGDSFNPFKTKPIGYVTTQFNPFTNRNLRRFEVV